MIVPPLSVALLVNAGQDPFPVACAEPVQVHHFHDLQSFVAAGADLYIDCEFEATPDRREQLARLRGLIMVNAVGTTTAEIGNNWVRFNGWKGFGQQSVLELATATGAIPEVVKQFALSCGLNIVIAPDIPGMVRARIVAMIINEAYHALGEGVSSESDIDTAMKLGTNYPFGPFEWAEKIGHSRVAGLLQKLAETAPEYQPAPALLAAAAQ